MNFERLVLGCIEAKDMPLKFPRNFKGMSPSVRETFLGRTDCYDVEPSNERLSDLAEIYTIQGCERSVKIK